jgi:hypothetical protein
MSQLELKHNRETIIILRLVQTVPARAVTLVIAIRKQQQSGTMSGKSTLIILLNVICAATTGEPSLASAAYISVAAQLCYYVEAHIQDLNTASFTCNDCYIAGYARPAQSAKYPVLPAAFSAVSVLDVDKLGPMVPQSFMGFSHEYPNVEDMIDIPQYVDVIKLLQSYGSGPLSLRIGGGSTDMQKTVPGPAVWDSLSKLHKATGMTYILGLNFYDQNVELAKNQMDAARKGLPEGSIQSFEIGNEVSS